MIQCQTPAEKMSQGQKFKKRWEFRRVDADYDTSSYDSKACSSSEPAVKKHKLASNFILSEHEETSDTPESQQKAENNPATGIQVEFREAKIPMEPTDRSNDATKITKRRVTKEGNRKKSNHSTYKPVSMLDLKMFTEAILGDLKVAREDMFERMSEQMDKLVNAKSVRNPKSKKVGCSGKTDRKQQQNGTESSIKRESGSGKTLDKAAKSNVRDESNICPKVTEEHVNNGKVIQTVTENQRVGGERSRLSANKPIGASDNSCPVVSSYLTLPSVLTETRVEKNRNNYSSMNYISQGVAGNNTSVTSETVPIINANAHNGYLSGAHSEEHIGSSALKGSKNMGCLDQHISQTSSTRTGFPFPLHRAVDKYFIPNQAVLENLCRDNSIVGLRMNGGALRFSGGNQALSGQFVANNTGSNMKYRNEGATVAFGTQHLKDCSFQTN